MNDPFAVLGVSSSATEDEIKAAYRKLAKKYHPDLNPGDKAAEQKMREVNEAYTQALQIRKNGGRGPQSGYGSYGGYGGAGGYGGGGSGGYGSSYGGSGGAGGGYQNPFGSYQRSGWDQDSDGYQGQSGNPFGDFGFGFGPFGGFGFDTGRQSTRFRPRSYANPDLQTAGQYILANRFTEAISLLNRVPVHDADWHALYAQADLGMGNRVSALDHARAAARMAPQDAEYQTLLRTVEAGGETYRQTRSQGYDFRSVICANPCLSCCAANMLLNCCLGGCGRYGMFC